MSRRILFVSVVVLAAGAVFAVVSANAQTPIQIYGAWHCSNDYCTWGTVRDMTDFGIANHWLIDRGDGTGLPSVHLVVLSFVQPLKLLNRTSDSGDINGVSVGMNSAVVDYFTQHNVRVMLSIGGATYTTYWDQALAQDATQLGLNAAALALNMGGASKLTMRTAPALTWRACISSSLPTDRRSRTTLRVRTRPRDCR